MLSGLAVCLAAAIGLAPLASATLLPNPAAPAVVPASPPAIATAADLPVSVIVTLTAGTVLMSMATTLATLALVRRRDQRLRAADPAQVTVPVPAFSPEEPPGPDDDILVSHLSGPERGGSGGRRRGAGPASPGGRWSR
jgi:hypothetical protein